MCHYDARRLTARTPQLAGAAAPAPVRSASEPVYDVYALAKAQFDLKEYLRAAHTLRVRCGARAQRHLRCADRDSATTAQGASGSKPRFLRCYALYLAGEKRKTEELVEVAGPMVRCAAPSSGRARCSRRALLAGALQRRREPRAAAT